MGSDDKPRLVLFSSDVRTRYAEDVLTALAGPAGMLLRFRYAVTHFAPELEAAARTDDGLAGCTATVVFIGGRESGAPVIVAVRNVDIVSSELVFDIVVMELRLRAYPEITPQQKLEGMREAGKALYKELLSLNDGEYYAVTNHFPPLTVGEAREKDAATAWVTISRALSRWPSFARTLFVRVIEVRNTRGEPFRFDSKGRVHLIEDCAARVRYTYVGAEGSESAEIVCTTDPEIVTLTSDARLPVGSRYDADEFAIYARPGVVGETWSRLAIAVEPPEGTTGPPPIRTRVAFPIGVHRSGRRRGMRAGMSALGSLLIALPALVGTEVPLSVEVAFAGAGAALIASVAYLLGGGR